MLPMRMTVSREFAGETKTFNVEVVRQPNLMGALLFSALVNSVDMEGDLPEEMEVRMDVEGTPRSKSRTPTRAPASPERRRRRAVRVRSPCSPAVWASVPVEL